MQYILNFPVLHQGKRQSTKHILRLTSQRVSEVLMFSRIRVGMPKGAQMTNVTPSTACNMSQTRRDLGRT